jgi:type VI secretion system protein ImpK
MTDAFAALVIPIFRKTIDLQARLARGEPRSLDDVTRMAAGWVEEARRRAMGVPGLQRSFEMAQYGIVAWIDEVLTESEWGKKAGSPEEILEWDLFDSRDRATLFYEHADQADEAGDMDALEIYLLGVTLGFRGKLVYDEAELADWVHRVYGRISEVGTVPDRPFADDPPRSEPFGPLRGPSWLLTVSVLVSITALVTLAAYLIAVHVEYNTNHQDASVHRLRTPCKSPLELASEASCPCGSARLEWYQKASDTLSAAPSVPAQARSMDRTQSGQTTKGSSGQNSSAGV